MRLMKAVRALNVEMPVKDFLSISGGWSVRRAEALSMR